MFQWTGRFVPAGTATKPNEVYAFENRCAHRGALIALEKSGKAESFQCVYHAWSYNRQGDLTGVAFEKGVKGQGGMPPDFCKQEHGPRKLRVAVYCGLVFGSFSDDVPPIEEYLGEEICARIERVLHKPVKVIGRFTQALPNDWKLYVENVRDSYHATASYMDAISRGARPGEMPVAQPTRFELVINLKTARALGLQIPQAFVLRADRVID